MRPEKVSTIFLKPKEANMSPKVRKLRKERSRNKNGKWRRKRSDAGKPRYTYRKHGR